MMQKRSLLSLMLISFMVVFAASLSFANEVVIESKNSLKGDNGVLNVTANVSADSINALEVVLEISAPGDGFFTSLSVDFDPAFLGTWDSEIDVITHSDGSTPDTIRFAAFRLDASAPLFSGSTLIATISFTTNESCGDDITLDGGTFDAGLAGLVTSSFVDDFDNSTVPVAITAGVVTIVNTTPTLAAISDASLSWGSLHTATAVGADPDPTDVLTYAKVSGPANLNIDPSTGAIVWATTGSDVCGGDVVISVTDNCGASVSVSYNICVTNEAPVFACPGDQSVMAGGDLVVSASATDSDSGPRPLLYTATTDHPGLLNVNPATGEITLSTDIDPSHTGTFSITVIVTDSAGVCDPCSPRDADTCTFSVTVFYNSGSISTTENVPSGKFADVSIGLANSGFSRSGSNGFTTTEIAGFDLRLTFDNSALAFQGASKGTMLENCSWEYFTYRVNGNRLHFVGLADQNDGAVNATCYEGSPGNSSLVSMSFLTSNDPGLGGVTIPIRYEWIDCGDNSLSSLDGEIHMISRYVSENVGGNLVRIDGLGDGTYPTPFGAQVDCDAFDNDRSVDFINGGITIALVGGDGNRGDINVNGLAHEVGDGVMFTNFFLFGLSAFDGHIDESIAASDVNADGIVLTVSDLVYLIRVIVGDAPAIPKVGDVTVKYTNDGGVLSVIEGAVLGAAYVVVSGNITPILKAENMELGFNYDSELDQTNILVRIPMAVGSEVTGFTGKFLEFQGEIISLEFATLEAASVTPVLVPTTFSLGQNYPNPFNPSTTIQLSLPQAGPWSLTIYNIQGQVVETFEGELSEAGFVDVVWDASEVASGVYFYRTRSGDNVATKKAVLLK